MVHVFKNDYNEYHYSVDDLRSIGENIIKNFRKNRNYIKSLISKDNKDFKQIFKFHRLLDSANIKKESTKKLIEMYKKTSDYYSQLLNRSHIIEGFSLTYDVEIKNAIESYLKGNKIARKPEEVFNILTTPEKSSFMLEEGRDLLGILAFIQSDKQLLNLFKSESQGSIIFMLKGFPKLHKALEEHRKNYYWIKNFYAGAKELKLNYFVSELKSMVLKGSDAKKLISEQQVRLKRLVSEKKSLWKKLSLPSEAKGMIELSNQLGQWQDDRKKQVLQSIHYLDALLLEIGRRHGIKDEFMRYLLPYEVTGQFLKKIDNDFLEERKKGCIIIAEGNAKGLVTEVLTGKDCAKFREMLEDHKTREFKEISGICASQGKATGKARVCKSHADILKFREGEVLVAPMTRPEYLPAMKKAAAIVTDEGGITSHAAIVSRELKIPCVVGTRVATKVLKDNTAVEVNANHGSVKVLD